MAPRASIDELLALHMPRQLVGLAAILDRIEGDLRAAPVLAALRLAFLHSVLPASRLATTQGRTASLRIGGGHVKLPTATQWRERNPWLAFEDGFRLVRGFVQRLEGGALGPCRPASARTCAAWARAPRRRSWRCPARPVCDCCATHPTGSAVPHPHRASGSSWVSHRCARDWNASVRRTTPRRGSSVARRLRSCRSMRWPGRRCARPWSWQAVTIGRAMEAAAPAMARDGRAVLLVDGGPEALAAAVLGGAGAGYPTGQRPARGW